MGASRQRKSFSANDFTFPRKKTQAQKATAFVEALRGIAKPKG